MHITSSFYVSVRNPNSGLLAHTASSLITEPYPQLPPCFMKVSHWHGTCLARLVGQQVTEIASMGHHASGLLKMSLEIGSGPHACLASILLSHLCNPIVRSCVFVKHQNTWAWWTGLSSQHLESWGSKIDNKFKASLGYMMSGFLSLW